MHNYVSANGSLPMSATFGKTKDDGRGNGHSGFTAILPYMEQAALWNSYNTSLENWHESNATTMFNRKG